MCGDNKYNIDLKEIGTVIKDRRKGLNITQLALGEKLNMSQGYIADIENGKVKNPSIKTFAKIADALGINLNRLFTAIENKNNELILTETEKDLIKLFRRIPKEDRIKVKWKLEGIIEVLLEQTDNKEKRDTG